MENLFEYYIENNYLHMKYAKGEPAVKEQEFHDYNEIVYFAEGTSFFVSKNIQQELLHGSIVIIPKEHFHQFRVKYPESYVRSILAFRTTSENAELISEVMNTVKVISKPDIHIVNIFNQLADIIKSGLSDNEKIMYINSSIIQLLIHLKLNASDAISENLNLSPMILKAVSLIDEKYSEKLSVKEIADALYISPSTLAHKFSNEMKISVYRYITKKRISAAHQLVEQGETLCNAALKCGFSDYSGFYRVYRKYYNN